MVDKELSELTSNMSDRRQEKNRCPDWLDVGGPLYFVLSPINKFILSPDTLLTAAEGEKNVYCDSKITDTTFNQIWSNLSYFG